MKILIIIQARMGSTRLPGKVLRKLNGRELLLRLIDNLKQNQHNAEIIVATSENLENDALIDALNIENIRWFRGDENDVLSRFISIVKKEQPDIVVRATADDPLMSAECMDIIIDDVIDNDLDYAVMKDLPRGITTEVFKASALLSLEDHKDLTARDHEHVTIYMYEHPEIFKIKYLDAIPKFYAPKLELTIDTNEEFEKMDLVYKYFGEEITLEKVIDYFGKEND